LEKSPRFHAIVRAELQKQFRNNLDIAFDGTITKINLLGLSLQLKDASAKPIKKEEGWSWQAERFGLSLSWLSFFYTKKFNVHVALKGYHATSEIKDGTFGIVSHLNNIIGGLSLPLPVLLQSVILQKASLKASDKNQNVTLQLSLNGQVGRSGNTLKTGVYITDGSLQVGDKKIVVGLTGKTTLVTYFTQRLHCHITNDLQMVLPHLQKQQTCFLEGKWDDGQGAWVVHNQDYSFHIDSLRLYQQSGALLSKGSLMVPFSYIVALQGSPDSAQKTTGTCDVTFMGNNTEQFTGTVTLKNPHYEGHGVDKVVCSFLTNGLQFHGSLSAQKQKGLCAGAWWVDLVKKEGALNYVNHTPWPLTSKTHWFIPEYQGYGSLVVVNNGDIKSDYHLCLQHEKTESKFISAGEGTLSADGKMSAKGTVDNKNYHFTAEFFPYFKPVIALLKDEKERPLFQFNVDSSDTSQFSSELSYQFLRSLLENYCDYDLPGQGVFCIKGSYNGEKLRTAVTTKDATIRLPETSNFIDSLAGQCTLSFNPLSVTIDNFNTQLHQGSVSCSQAKIAFDQNYEVDFIHIPLVFDKCFLNWKDDFFAVCSGGGVFQKRQKQPYEIEGFVTIEKGQLKENPLSVRGQTEVTQFMLPSSFAGLEDLVMRVKVMTRDPLYIKTEQLQSRAVIDIELSNTLLKPHLTGSLKLLGGKLFLPYKPLYITQATLQFLPDQPQDPLVEFTAQGTVKKYGVTLSVGGSLQNPQLNLHTVPALNEEQILALLFTGTVEDSLNVMVPTFVARNIETLLFGSAHSKVSDSWFDPFRHIRIIPSFADQTGTGGFKGAVEIDVTDQLHAKLQKNFSLAEDTRIEIEWLASDDIAIKGIKDERSDLGAEVEMRFKF
jgi:hypothetical protein